MTAPSHDTEVLATLRALQADLASLRAAVARIEDVQARRDELWDEMMPIGKLALESLANRFEVLEAKGIFAFGNELLGVGERVVEAFGPDDVRALGDSIVSILTTVRTWTQPGMMTLAQEAGAALESNQPDEKLGVFGMLSASRDDDVQHGAALAIGVLRRLGRAVRAGANRSPQVAGRPQGWSRLAARLGPSGAVTPPAAARSAMPAAAQRTESPRAAALRSVSVPIKPQPPAAADGAQTGATTAIGPVHLVPAGYDRLAWDAEGYLRDAGSWTEALAAAIALQHGITLDTPRLAVLIAARDHAAGAGSAPNVRKLAQVAAITTRELYTLFPDRPGSTVARIAGLPKPVGCV